MNFNEAFLNSLHTNVNFTKSLSIEDYLPFSLSESNQAIDSLPYIQAYNMITCTYPYYYEIAELYSYCLIYTESGGGSLTVDEMNYSLNPDSFAFIDCSKKHRIEIKQSPWQYIVYFINGTPIPDLYHNFIENYGNLHEFSSGSNVPLLIKKLYMSVKKDSNNVLLQSRLLLDILLDAVMEKNNKQEPKDIIPLYLENIKHNFEENYHECFHLDDLEQQYHISKYRICREFTEYYDVSPIQFLTLRRLQVAKEALLTTDRRINEIGRMVGYENTNLFIRLFKENTGVTPLVFRKNPPTANYLFG